ncbi:MAG: DUF1549 and DUF1553 domain-containing protein [Planctomycetes bacterium]|nr:DUF1549 and DUF1553 domain-containing protein [Planctomycetota bacterium]
MKHAYLPAASILLACVQGALSDDYVIPEAKKAHWAWKAPVRPPVPTVQQVNWVQTPIDAFILARMGKAGLMPAATAEREQVLRRVTFDLIGLPPTPQEIDAFVSDASPQAWTKVIDRLLASPHYGERWGRHWLDLARYADSNGYEFDEDRPNAWRYRDYVIQSFNSNKPYDRFIQEQLAGDELFPDDPQALVATAFHLLGPDMTDSSNQALRRQNTLDDMTETTGLVFLGMTIGCARCHDHKFEPIPQRDFFRLQAFFAPAVFRSDIPFGSAKEMREHAQAMELYQKLVQPTLDEIAKVEAPYRKKLFETKLALVSAAAQEAHRTPPEKRTPAQKKLIATTERLVAVSATEVRGALIGADADHHKQLQDELKKFDAKKPRSLPTALGVKDGIKDPKTVVLVRGELNNPGAEVDPGFPLILSPGLKESAAPVRSLGTETSGRRTALAQWIASKDNPLTARVLVNRLWQAHFGRGIVPTASDFGVHGEQPTHPELLDWLAVEFMEKGWDVKHMHRLMLSSATYQQSTQASKEALVKDPKNDWLGRMNVKRLEAEALRDSLLAVSGQLNRKMGGPGVLTPLPADALPFKEWKPHPDAKEHNRRSVYLFAKRNLRHAFLDSFDLPDSNLSCSRREQSTVATQALTLFNSAGTAQAVKALAARLEKEAATTDDRITLAIRSTLGRRPTESEVQLARDFLRDSPLVEFCRALFNVNEFVYLR